MNVKRVVVMMVSIAHSRCREPQCRELTAVPYVMLITYLEQIPVLTHSQPQGCGVLIFSWDPDSGVRKCRTLDSGTK